MDRSREKDMNIRKVAFITDLTFILTVAWISYLFIIIPFISKSPFSLLSATILTFFIPGYSIVATFFPQRNDLNLIERVTFSIFLSIISTISIVFLLSFTDWQIRPNNTYFLVCLLTTFFVFVAHHSRRSYPGSELYLYEIYDSVRELKPERNSYGPEKLHEDPRKQFNLKSKKKIVNRQKDLNLRPIEDKLPSNIEYHLIVTLIFAIIAVSSVNIYMGLNLDKDPFSVLYILGPDGKAETYPSTLSIYQPTKIIVGIDNYEFISTNYTLRIRFDGEVLEQTEIVLDHKDKWEQEVSITPQRYKSGRQKLEFILYKDSSVQPYRSVHLWITQELDAVELPENIGRVIDFITIQNPSMDLDTGWVFSTTNESVAYGSYIDGAGIYSGRTYVINSTYQGILPLITRHSIFQEIQSDRTENVLLSVYLKDSYTGGTTGKDEVQYMQIMLNGVMVWTDGINGDKGWQRLQVPVTVKEGKNTLAFTLMQNRNQLLNPVEMRVDDIIFQPVSEISPYRRADNTIEFNLPTSKVLQLPKTTSTEDFMVSWNGTDIGSGIAYYNIDYSTDGINWQRWLSGTTLTSTQFNGKAGTTYHFRSMAVDKAQNREPEHLLPDTSTTIDMSRLEMTLEITPNPTNETTNVVVKANRPLSEIRCTLTSHGFRVTDTLKLTTKDGGITWTGKYILKVDDNFNVEVTGKDFSNNTGYVFGTIYFDTSLEKLTIKVYPETASSEVEISITSSTTLEDIPTITVRDKNGKTIKVEYMSQSGNVYRYTATIDSSIADGLARVTATAKTVNSENLYEEKTFTIKK